MIADHRVEPARQSGDEPVCLRQCAGRRDLRLAGIRRAECDVLAHAPAQHKPALRHEADQPPEPLHVKCGNVLSAHANPALLRLVEAEQQMDQCRLTRTVRAGQRHRLPRRDVERQTIQHQGAPRIGEADVLEADRQHVVLRHLRRRIAALGLDPQHCLQPRQRAAGNLKLAINIGERAYGPRQQCSIEQEGKQLGRVAPARLHLLSGKDDDRHGGQRHDQGEYRAGYRLHPRLRKSHHAGLRRLGVEDVLPPALHREGLDRGQHIEVSFGGDHDIDLGLAHLCR